MIDWRTDWENAPTTPLDADTVRQLLVWVKDEGIAIGCVYIHDSGHRTKRAHGYSGRYELTHWAETNPPEGA